MRRFFVLPEDLNQETVQIVGDEFHHLKNVSRLSEGEHIELLDGHGNIAFCQIVKIEKKAALVKVIKIEKLTPQQGTLLHVFLCIPKFQTMDVVIQKLVELGVQEVTPLLSERSFLRKNSKELENKIQRWNKIALQACKQSARPWPLKLNKVKDLKSIISSANPSETLFLYEGQSSTDIKAALETLQQPPQINIVIGAEGGFSPQEVELFQRRGIKSATLGDLVLRVETACIAAVSVIKYHLNLLK